QWSRKADRLHNELVSRPTDTKLALQRKAETKRAVFMAAIHPQFLQISATTLVPAEKTAQQVINRAMQSDLAVSCMPMLFEKGLLQLFCSKEKSALLASAAHQVKGVEGVDFGMLNIDQP